MSALKNRIISLIDKVEKGIATAEELDELNVWYATFEEEDSVTDQWNLLEKKEFEQKLFNNIKHQLNPVDKQKKFKTYFLSSIVIVVTLVASSIYYFYPKNKETLQNQHVLDVKPGRETAILTLADGSKINLDEIKSGVVAEQADVDIIQNADGFLSYKAGHIASQNGNLNNTISTPVGGTYKIILPDGTRVWLNAASAIEFPISFNNKERIVKTKGEVYFEVAKQIDSKTKSNIPFKVLTTQLNRGQQLIEVLGTHFNVNSYDDETAIRTTLLEGAVKVSSMNNQIVYQTVKLLPGEQAATNKSNVIAVAKAINLKEVVAWKNGYFEFDNTQMDVLMRQIARWYNINVEYDKNAKNDTFYGKLERSYTLNEVLKILELGNVNFEVTTPKGDGTVATLRVLP